MVIEKLRRVPEGALLIGLITTAILFFGVTNPKSLPPVALMIAFGLVLAITFVALRLIFRILRLRSKLPKGQYTALLICLSTLPVMLLALQSLGQLTARDMVVLALLFGGCYFYISRLYRGSTEDKDR